MAAMNAVLIILAAILGAFVHRFRGGWPDKPLWMIGHARLWSALFVFLLLWVVLPWDVSVIVAILYLAGSTFGWHNWMNCGDPMTYRNAPNVLPIDWLLYKIYGPYWVPKGADFGAGRFSIPSPSPSRGVRSEAWRIRVACTGMFLRGALYWPMLLVLPVLHWSWLSFALSFVWLLFGPVYGLSRWVFNRTKDRINYRDDSLTIAEPLVGALFGLAIGVQVVLSGG